MKKIFLTMALVLSSIVAVIADEVKPVITVNGTEVEKAMSEITFSGNNVIISYVDGTSASFAKTDEIILTFDGTTAVGSVEAAYETFSYNGIVDGQLKVSGLADGTKVQVYSASGLNVGAGVVADGSVSLNVSGLSSGVYVLRVGKNVIKFMKK